MKTFPVGRLFAASALIAAISLFAGLVQAHGRLMGGAPVTSAPARGGVIEPALAAQLASADPTAPIEALVVLKQQAALSSDAGTSWSY
jgi:hypothetical protein